MDRSTRFHAGGYIKPSQEGVMPLYWHSECQHHATHPEPRRFCDFLVTVEVGRDQIVHLTQSAKSGKENG